MPKKLNTNPKAQEARERKEAVKVETRNKAAQAADAVAWADQGQSAAEKRAADKEKKRLEDLAKREAKRIAQLRDEAEMKSVKQVKVNPHKITLSQIQTTFGKQQQKEAEERAAEQEMLKQNLLKPIELSENLNRTEEDTIAARSVDEAIMALAAASIGPAGNQTAEDRHPEKRLKAAFRAYEEANWDTLKRENPTLKFSQLKDLLFRQWQKSPDNPLNQTISQSAK